MGRESRYGNAASIFGGPARQNSINDVGSPRRRQNKFQLRPRGIGFPRSIRGLRTVGRVHASDWLPFSLTRQSRPPDPPLVAATLQQSCRQDLEINNSLRTDAIFPVTAPILTTTGCVSLQQVGPNPLFWIFLSRSRINELLKPFTIIGDGM